MTSFSDLCGQHTLAYLALFVLNACWADAFVCPNDFVQIIPLYTKHVAIWKHTLKSSEIAVLYSIEFD